LKAFLKTGANAAPAASSHVRLLDAKHERGIATLAEKYALLKQQERELQAKLKEIKQALLDVDLVGSTFKTTYGQVSIYETERIILDAELEEDLKLLGVLHECQSTKLDLSKVKAKTEASGRVYDVVRKNVSVNIRVGQK